MGEEKKEQTSFAPERSDGLKHPKEKDQGYRKKAERPPLNAWHE